MTDEPLPAQSITGVVLVNRSWLVLAWLTAAILAVVLALVTWRYLTLRSELDQACAPDSVVARLDLTEWVPLCR